MQVSQLTSTFTITPPRTRGGPHRPTRRVPPQPAHLLDTPEQRRYHILRPNKHLITKGGARNPGKPTRPHPRTHPRNKLAPETSGVGNAVPSPRVPCPFPSPPGDGKTPWIAIVPCEAPYGAAALCSGVARSDRPGAEIHSVFRPLDSVGRGGPCLCRATGRNSGGRLRPQASRRPCPGASDHPQHMNGGSVQPASSIAYPSKTHTMQPQTPQPNNPSPHHPHPPNAVIPAEAGRRCAYGVNPSLRNNHPEPSNSP